jgi:hypothetical protein
VKHVNGETVCWLNVTVLLCVGDSTFVVIIYNSVIFLDRSSFEGMCCSIFRLLVLVFWPEELCDGDDLV